MVIMGTGEKTLRIRVTAQPALADIFSVDKGTWFDHVFEVKNETSLSELLGDLARTFPAFKPELLTPREDSLSSRIEIFLNGKLLMLPAAEQVKLSDRDIIIFLPAHP